MRYLWLILGWFVVSLTFSQEYRSQRDLKGEIFFETNECLGNVAVTKSGQFSTRYFYTIHPESHPKGTKLYEIVEGRSKPYPTAKFQDRLKNPLGLYIDLDNRLWVLDHGMYGWGKPKIFCFDLNMDTLLLEYSFKGKHMKRKGVMRSTMLNDLCVYGDSVFISAPGLFKKNSSIIYFSSGINAHQEPESEHILKNHSSVTRKKITPVVDGKKMRFIAGLYKVRPGVDGVDISHDGKYIYYTAMSHDTLFRLDLGMENRKPEAMFKRPVCDGIRVDHSGNIYLTDVEQHQILKFDQAGNSEVLFKNPEAHWVDGLSVGNDGYLYITDSKLQYVMMKRPKKYKKYLPFRIYRVKIDE